MYTVIFLMRYYPFWAIPVGLVFFELGVYFYNRRDRAFMVAACAMAGFLALSSIVWVVFEGYWRAGPLAKRTIEWLGF